MRTLIIILALVISGCVTAPNLQTGEGCWRYGVEETTPTQTVSTDITYLSTDDLYAKCGSMVWGCYQPWTHKIYVSKAGGKRSLYEEQCHSLGLLEHNNCYPHYGMWGKDESDCNWNKG